MVNVLTRVLLSFGQSLCVWYVDDLGTYSSHFRIAGDQPSYPSHPRRTRPKKSSILAELRVQQLDLNH